MLEKAKSFPRPHLHLNRDLARICLQLLSICCRAKFLWLWFTFIKSILLFLIGLIFLDHSSGSHWVIIELSQRAILSASFTYLWKNWAQEDRSYLPGIPEGSHNCTANWEYASGWEETSHLHSGRKGSYPQEPLEKLPMFISQLKFLMINPPRLSPKSL